MWKALREIQSQYPPLASTNLEELIARADKQHDALEHERLAAGALALATARLILTDNPAFARQGGIEAS